MKKSFVWIAGLVMIVAGCNQMQGSGPRSTLTIAPPSNPYQSTTKTPLPATPTIPLATTIPIIPTPTPFTHAIQSGETLYGIALTYGVSFDKLVSANPGLDPRMLTVGTEITIPFDEEETSPPTPTPYPLPLDQPNCYPSGEEDLYCFAVVENNQNTALESISLAFNFLDTDQEVVNSLVGFPPVNILYPGQSIPIGILVTDFSPTLTLGSTSLLSAYPATQQAPLVEVTDYTVTYTQANTIAQIEGTYDLQSEGEIDQIWIVGIAYNQGQVVGLRKWVGSLLDDQAPPYTFEFFLYSLGPEIDQVALIGEVH